MIVTLPAADAHLAAMSLTGWTRRAGEAAPVLRGAVVLKGDFVLERSGAGGSLVARPATTPPEISVADEGEVTATGYWLTREADVALEKAHADVVVEGWTHGATGGCVRVDGTVWSDRRVGPPDPDDADADPDTRVNLFGWLSKTHPSRAITATVEAPLAAYHPGYNNVSRRDADDPGPTFTAPTEDRLPAGAAVSIARQPCATPPSSPFDFRLPQSLSYVARLRAYCGHGPDRAPRWSIVDTVPLVPDTLVVRPRLQAEESTATVVWRASWRHDAVPAEHWRMVEILPGGD